MQLDASDTLTGIMPHEVTMSVTAFILQKKVYPKVLEIQHLRFPDRVAQDLASLTKLIRIQ